MNLNNYQAYEQLWSPPRTVTAARTHTICEKGNGFIIVIYRFRCFNHYCFRECVVDTEDRPWWIRQTSAGVNAAFHAGVCVVCVRDRGGHGHPHYHHDHRVTTGRPALTAAARYLHHNSPIYACEQLSYRLCTFLLSVSAIFHTSSHK